MKNLIIYHRVDYDGVFSALILKKWCKKFGKEVELLGWNYGDDVPTIDPDNYEKILMGDISFPPTLMMWLANTGKLIWFDHHHTAIEDSKKFKYDSVKGHREIGISAAEICWKFCFDDNIPRLIGLLSSYDVWNKDRFDWENDVIPLQDGLKLEYGLKVDKIDPDFDDMLVNQSALDYLIKVGQKIGSYNKQRWTSSVKNHAFKILIDGRIPGICMIGTEFTSRVFESVEDNFDTFCVANISRVTGFSVSLYTQRLDFNCGEYMKKNFNGGGHKGAAGGTMDFSQFTRLIKDRRL